MAFLELMPAKRQRVWEWPAVVNLTLGGAGAGLYLIGTLIARFSHPWTGAGQFIVLPLLAVAVVGLGFLTLTLEAGRPLRGYRLFSRLSNSWMSVESLSGALFIFTAAAGYWFPSTYLHMLAVMSAMVLIVSQGMMLYWAVGVSAWHRGLTPILFVTSGLTAACGLLLINTKRLPAMARLTILLMMALVLLNLIVWLFYLYGRSVPDSNRGFEFMRRPVLLLLIGGIGHLLPIIYLGSFLLPGYFENSDAAASYYRVVSGLMLLGGVVLQKTGMIMAMGFFRPILVGAMRTDNTSMPA